MVWTKFELDEQKAQELSGMSVSEVWDFINKIAIKTDLIVVRNGKYHAKGDSKDQSNLAIFILERLFKIEWFIKSVKSWVIFYDDGVVEDVISILKEETI